MTKSREMISYSPYTLALLGVIGATLVCYLYFLNLSVVHVVIRQEVMQDLQDTKNQIAYLKLSLSRLNIQLLQTWQQCRDLKKIKLRFLLFETPHQTWYSDNSVCVESNVRIE